MERQLESRDAEAALLGPDLVAIGGAVKLHGLPAWVDERANRYPGGRAEYLRGLLDVGLVVHGALCRIRRPAGAGDVSAGRSSSLVVASLARHAEDGHRFLDRTLDACEGPPDFRRRPPVHPSVAVRRAHLHWRQAGGPTGETYAELATAGDFAIAAAAHLAHASGIPTLGGAHLLLAELDHLACQAEQVGPPGLVDTEGFRFRLRTAIMELPGREHEVLAKMAAELAVGFDPPEA